MQGFPVIGEYVGFGPMAVEAHRDIEMGWMMETEPPLHNLHIFHKTIVF